MTFRVPSAIALVALAACVEPNLNSSEDPPVAVIQSPADGASFDEGASITLNGKVADDGDVTNVVVSWIDNGATVLLAEQFPDAEGFVSFTTADLAVGAHAITLRAVDPSNLSHQATVDLTVVDVADEPDLTILAPAAAARFPVQADVSFEATVSDAKDVATDLSVDVSSDVDGFLCAPIVDSLGAAVCATALTSPGTHRITFTVTDTDGFSRSRTVVITADPVVEIPSITPVSPTSGSRVRVGTPIQLTATVDDLQDAPSALVADVASDVDGTLCTLSVDSQGNAACFATFTTLGTQLLTFGVTDTDGNDGTANVLVVVSDGTDVDDDGDGYSEVQGDCDDSDDTIAPGIAEQPDRVDQDCDDLIDEGTALYDDDGDGYCESLAIACSDGALGGDCNDGSLFVNPGAAEVCGDFVDNDCDTTQNEPGALSCVTYWYDGDSDSYGLVDNSQCLCAPSGPYRALNDDDCDDALASVHPGATEAPDRLDNNCNTTVDEGTVFYDDDLDGYCDSPNQACSDGAQPGDCNDGAVSVNPGVPEQCGNGIDDNCSGVQNEAGAQGCTVWYADADGDGYGSAATSGCTCAPPANTALNSADCNDANSGVKPGATELGNGIDDDCDGTLDEGTALYDNDGDGYCASGSCTAQPGQPAPLGGDCDDVAFAINPGASEVCGNGVDDDCDRQQNEGPSAVGCTMFYQDQDLDGFGGGAGACLCAADTTYIRANGSDCYDLNAEAKPGQTGWFSVHRGDGSFDYNCALGEEPKVAQNVDCGCPDSTFDAEPFVPGWDGTPACGTFGPWVTSCTYVTAQIPNPFYPILGGPTITECVSDDPATVTGVRLDCR